MKKKILIVGNDANAYALAKKLSKEHEIIVTPISDGIKEFAETLDIKETKPNEILEYVLENQVDMTIVVSEKSIETDIVTLFQKNNQKIFAPTAKANDLVKNKDHAKKAFYKLKIPTPKFGIFEKDSMAQDYIKKQQYPCVIKTNEPNSATVITSDNVAKKVMNSLFIEKNKKILIEDYIYGTSFSFYAITDGYKALPIGSSLNYRYSLDGDGGQLTSGMGSCVPNYKLSIDDEYFLMDDVIYKLITYIENGDVPYIGIIGVDGIKTQEGQLLILGCNNFLQNADAAAILENIDEDIISLFESCILGSFSDEIEMIKLKDKYAVSLALNCNKKNNENNSISGLDQPDDDTTITFFPSVKKNKYMEFSPSYGQNLILTSFSSTVSSASKKAYLEAEYINFTGKIYRKDICNI